MKSIRIAALLAAVMAIVTFAPAGDLDPPGPPSPTMQTLDDLGALTEANEQLLLELLPETGSICAIAVCLPGGTCPVGGNPVPFAGSKIFNGCSKAAAQKKANKHVAAVCAAGFPCNGTCDDQAEECTSWVSPLSYSNPCAPATVAGCLPNDDPHVCWPMSLPAGSSTITCQCNCTS